MPKPGHDEIQREAESMSAAHESVLKAPGSILITIFASLIWEGIKCWWRRQTAASGRAKLKRDHDRDEPRPRLLKRAKQMVRTTFQDKGMELDENQVDTVARDYLRRGREAEFDRVEAAYGAVFEYGNADDFGEGIE
jgi:hypothetical protein